MRNVLIKKDKHNLNRLELDRFSKVLLTDIVIDEVNESVNLSEMKLHISNLNSDIKNNKNIDNTDDNSQNDEQDNTNKHKNNPKINNHLNVARGGFRGSKRSKHDDENNNNKDQN